MASPEEQILQAIAVASNHSLQGQEIHSQAIAFLNKVRSESAESWRPALSLFVATNNDNGSRRFADDVRLFALNIIADFLNSRNTKHTLDAPDFATLKEQFISYLRSEYLYGPAEANASFIRNKFSHTLTLLFLDTYESQWPDFFDDVFSLLKPPPEAGVQPLNPHVSLFFFKLLMEISSEIADQIMKNARAFSAERMARDGRIRDLVRDRDAAKINQAVLTIVVDAKQKIDQIRAGNAEDKAKLMEEVVDLGVRSFASYVPWVDINLTVTPETIPLLFSLLSDPSLPIRLATCSSLGRIITKGLKVASDKVKLFQVLSLGPVLDQLEAQTKVTEQSNESVLSFREALARVANFLGVELVALCNDTSLPPDEMQAAAEMLLELMPTILRFLADPYDDTSSTVLPLLTDILLSYKKAKQTSPQTHMTPEKREFLQTTLGILIDKLKWDEDEDPDEMDPDDLMMFDNMRKDIRKAIDSISFLDTDLVTTAVSERAQTTLDAYESGNQVPWEVAELAIYLVFMYGELGGKEKSKGRLAFCMAPTNIPKEARKNTDYSEYPLTPQGEMMEILIRSRISTYPHPTVAMQFFETATRYADFFKVRKENVLPALEAFLDNRGIHHPLAAVRKRVFYLFFRFVQVLRIDIETQHVPPILQAIQDLLTFEVEIPEDMDEEIDKAPDEFLANVLKTPVMFDSQLYMFEAAGALISILWSMPEPQAAALQTVSGPILSKLSTCLQTPLTGTPEDYVNILATHHCIQALGSIPKGFPEFPSPIPPGYIMPPIAEFRQISEAILVSLDVMGRFRVVREAARFAFGRIIFAAGPSITEYIPRLMSSLLSHFETTEFVEFIGFISHMTHKLQDQLRGVLDDVLVPLSNHVSTVVSQSITGTDDKVARLDTKKAYLNFLNTIMSSNLGSVFVSQTNVANLEPFLETILQMAADTSDPLNEKLALIFITKFVSLFGHATQPTNGSAGATNGVIIVPGVEQFIYQRVLVVAFSIPFLPDFNLKDGQSIAALNEISNLLQTIAKVRGDEALTYISTVFLPSQNLPPEKSLELANNMRTLDKRSFQKYLADFVKASRAS